LAGIHGFPVVHYQLSIFNFPKCQRTGGQTDLPTCPAKQSGFSFAPIIPHLDGNSSGDIQEKGAQAPFCPTFSDQFGRESNDVNMRMKCNPFYIP